MAEAIQFYKDKERRAINPTLFSTIAEERASTVYKSGGREANRRSQLRKFYDEVLRLNTLVKTNPADWDNILPFVNMLIAKAVYAQGRNKVSEDFVRMIKEGITQVQKKDDLEIFANFFEAFMGYYRQYNDKN
jgi:CRISPR-associated protein Csm2